MRNHALGDTSILSSHGLGGVFWDPPPHLSEMKTHFLSSAPSQVVLPVMVEKSRRWFEETYGVDQALF